MNALTPITPNLVKLVPLLDSDESGGLVATMHSIWRTLQSANLEAAA